MGVAERVADGWTITDVPLCGMHADTFAAMRRAERLFIRGGRRGSTSVLFLPAVDNLLGEMLARLDGVRPTRGSR